ncbi:MAG: helix-turn-helix domain-containing protein [Methanomassiliicoccales archaeon]|nr:MAG: helix-turn-helix domain-containing protein [Methanomassiliicoccales archaeon]
MRKVTVEIVLSPEMKKAGAPIMDYIESIRVLEVLKIDFEKGIKAFVAELKSKEGYGLDDFRKQKNMEILNVLKTEGNKYTCIIKGHVPMEFRKLMREFDLDLIWDAPMFLSGEKVVFSAIGDQKNIKKFLEAIKLVGIAKNISFKKGAFKEHDLLSCLTDKQREIVIQAMKNGYYDYPKKINSEDLSKKVGVSKATLLEHLRKAEGRLLKNLLVGY